MPVSVLRRFVTVALLAMFAGSLWACAPRSRAIEAYNVGTDISGFELDESAAPTLVYRRPGAPTLAAYTRFIVDPVFVRYEDPTLEDLDPEDVAKIQRYFQDAMIKELREGGYEVGTRTQEGTMRISMTLSGMKAPNALPNVTLVAQPIVISVGEVTVEAHFSNAAAARVDAVVVDRSQGSRFMNNSPWSTWSDVKSTADKWAEGVREAIDKAHAKK